VQTAMVASSGSKRSTNKVPHAQEPAAEEVWMDNLEDAFSTMQDLAESYPYIAMDTLLPGIVVQPTGPFDSYGDYNYQTLKCNVDLTRSLQISITLADADGIRPKGISTWKFNFNYDASKDFLVQDRRDALRRDLEKHETQGIEPVQFGEQLMSSGLVLNEEVKWIVFHGSSSFSDRPPAEHMSGHAGGEQACVTFSGMYNFGYLLQLLTSSAFRMRSSVFGKTSTSSSQRAVIWQGIYTSYLQGLLSAAATIPIPCGGHSSVALTMYWRLSSNYPIR